MAANPGAGRYSPVPGLPNHKYRAGQKYAYSMPPDAAQISVLYVDDEPELLELGKLFLESMGDFAITTVGSAAPALELLSTEKFDLVLSDYLMPGMDGIGLLKEVRSRFGDIPFILFTGKGREEIVVQAINNGADFYLQKGGDPSSQFSELAHKIRQAVRRRRAEAALAESRDYLDRIFSSVRAGIMVIDAGSHTIIDINPAAAQMIGLPRDQITGRVCHRYVCPAESGRCPLSDAGLTVDNSEKILLTADGGQVPIIKYATSVILGGRPCFLETFIDNSARKQAEQELRAAYDELKHNQDEIQAAYAELAANEQVLTQDYAQFVQNEQKIRESEAQFRLIFDSANDAIALSENGIFTRCNRKTLEIFGCSDESEIIGHSIAEFSPEFQPDGKRSSGQVVSNDEEVLSGSPLAFEWVHIRRDGTPFTAEISLNRIETGGKTVVQSIIRDITDRKRAEAAAALASKKLYMMNEVTRHEIRNLVTGIIGCVDMAYTMPAGGEREDLNREIKHLILRIQHQIDFTENYQEIGIRMPEWQRVQQLIPHSGGVSVRVSPEISSIEVYADPLLAKIFVYLTENVARHGVHATEIAISAHPAPRSLVIIFEDNGTGVPDERKEVIFTRREGDRKGMGLFLVREILAITGITITENGKYGSGARFEMVVPASVYRTLH
jgi:PAS domain S-box-containing protein